MPIRLSGSSRSVRNSALRLPKRRVVDVGGFRATPLIRQYVKEVLDSGRLSYGPFHRRFEAAFAAAHGCRHAAFCNSGTSALHLAVQALKEKHRWPDGSEVLVPAITFVATSNVVLHNRLTPVFVDVDPCTYTIDPGLAEWKITPRTRGIIPVHLLGLPADMDQIMADARYYALSVIEDSAETVLARYKGKYVGSMGDIGCFSTYVAHHFVTGVGGLTTMRDPDLYTRVRSLLNHGRDSMYLTIDDDKDAAGKLLHEIVAKRFQFVSVGHSFRATELEAAIGLAQLDSKERMLELRRATAARLTEGLLEFGHRLQLPSTPPDREHAYMMYGIVMHDEDKTALVNFLEERGIETRALLPLLNQPIYKSLFGDIEKSYPVARKLNRSGFYIGCHPYMTIEDTDYVIEVFRDFFRTRRRPGKTREANV